MHITAVIISALNDVQYIGSRHTGRLRCYQTAISMPFGVPRTSLRVCVRVRSLVWEKSSEQRDTFSVRISVNSVNLIRSNWATSRTCRRIPESLWWRASSSVLAQNTSIVPPWPLCVRNLSPCAESSSDTSRPRSVIICPIAIAYSMGQIIKSVCVCLSVCLSVCVSIRVSSLSRSHFFVDFH